MKYFFFLFVFCFFVLAQPKGTPVIHPNFEMQVIDSDPQNPAWLNVGDIDLDKVPELIVSVFHNSGPLGTGHVSIYKQKNGAWVREILPNSTGTPFPNDTTLADVDKDGDMDIILPFGFLATAPFSSGGLCWFENKRDGWEKHTICRYRPLFYHYVEYVDLTNDNIEDMLTVAEHFGESEVHLFKGLGHGNFETQPATLAKPALGSLPTVLDLDNDGDLDIISSQYFATDCSASWIENRGAEGWKKHVICNTVGPCIQLSIVSNLLGNGKKIAILSNHTNTADKPEDPQEAVFLLTVPETYAELTSLWPIRQISTGIKSRPSPFGAPQAAPGIFRCGDIDGDGDLDIVVFGDGDPTVYWLENKGGGEFTTNKLMTDMPQGGIAMYDLNQDNKPEIFLCSYETNRLVILWRQ
jgi:hypothetical protein